MTSAVRRLLDELSWEGNARKYRDGGLGLENVVTTEVFQALDFLPRAEFLGRVLAGASGSSLQLAQADAERAKIDVLPGDLTEEDLGIRAQPDVCIESPEAFVFVEAKRLRRSSFQPDQLAKELILTADHAGRRHPALLLVLPSPPPVRVQGHGTMSIEDAVRLGEEVMAARHGRAVAAPVPESLLAWTTWERIGAAVTEAMDSYRNPDPSTYATVRRITNTVTDALLAHA